MTDEKLKAKRQANAAKAREARVTKHMEEVWAEVMRYRVQHPGCTCDIRKGMTRDQVVATKSCHPLWQCPVIDKYRRLMGH